MKTFADIKPGDKLLVKGRRIETSPRTTFQEWGEVTVESVTRAYYMVNGEKYRKDQNGYNWIKTFRFPGQDGAPEHATPPGEFDKILVLLNICHGLDFIGHSNLNKIQDLEKRAELAEKLRSVLNEIKEAGEQK